MYENIYSIKYNTFCIFFFMKLTLNQKNKVVQVPIIIETGLDFIKLNAFMTSFMKINLLFPNTSQK